MSSPLATAQSTMQISCMRWLMQAMACSTTLTTRTASQRASVTASGGCSVSQHRWDASNMWRQLCSLVPRPFPPPVFDRLQYANTEGEGLGDLVTTLGRQMIGTQGAVPNRNNSQFASTNSPSVVNNELPCKHSWPPTLRQTLQERALRSSVRYWSLCVYPLST